MTVHTSRRNGAQTLRMNDLATVREVQAINVRILDAYHDEHVLPLIERIDAMEGRISRRLTALEAKARRPWWKLWGGR